LGLNSAPATKNSGLRPLGLNSEIKTFNGPLVYFFFLAVSSELNRNTSGQEGVSSHLKNHVSLRSGKQIRSSDLFWFYPAFPTGSYQGVIDPFHPEHSGTLFDSSAFLAGRADTYNFNSSSAKWNHSRKLGYLLPSMALFWGARLAGSGSPEASGGPCVPEHANPRHIPFILLGFAQGFLWTPPGRPVPQLVFLPGIDRPVGLPIPRSKWKERQVPLRLSTRPSARPLIPSKYLGTLSCPPRVGLAATASC
jgi:hypothetical protein